MENMEADFKVSSNLQSLRQSATFQLPPSSSCIAHSWQGGGPRRLQTDFCPEEERIFPVGVLISVSVLPWFSCGCSGFPVVAQVLLWFSCGSPVVLLRFSSVSFRTMFLSRRVLQRCCLAVFLLCSPVPHDGRPVDAVSGRT